MFKRIINVIDVHVGGCPLRVVTGGINWPMGLKCLEDYRDFLRKNDDIRQLLINEPRGGSNGAVAVLVPPFIEKADIAVVLLEPDSYPPMCGHCIIGVATVAAKMGFINFSESNSHFNIETPAGLVEASVQLSEGEIENINLKMPKSFFYKEIKLKIRDKEDVCCWIAFGGDFYGIVEAQSVGLKLNKKSKHAIINVGNEIRKQIQKQIKICHPDNSLINKIYQVMIFESIHKNGGKQVIRNAVICPPGIIDRSPCGTGTAAYMSVLYNQGKLMPGDYLESLSIINTKFVGTFTDTIKGKYQSIIPIISGSGYITGIGQIILENNDPFPAGYNF